MHSYKTERPGRVSDDVDKNTGYYQRHSMVSRVPSPPLQNVLRTCPPLLLLKGCSVGLQVPDMNRTGPSTALMMTKAVDGDMH